MHECAIRVQYVPVMESCDRLKFIHGFILKPFESNRIFTHDYLLLIIGRSGRSKTVIDLVVYVFLTSQPILLVQAVVLVTVA
jgi:hypothetical protein